MSGEDLRQKALQQQYFSFTSSEFIEDFLEQVEKHISEILHSTGEEMLQIVRKSDRDALRVQLINFEKLVFEKTKEHWPKLEESVASIFTVPLSCNCARVTSDDIKQLQEEIEVMEIQNTQEAEYAAKLKAVLKKFEGIQPLCQDVDEALQYNKVHEDLNEDRLEVLFKLTTPKKPEITCDMEDPAGLFKVDDV